MNDKYRKPLAVGDSVLIDPPSADSLMVYPGWAGGDIVGRPMVGVIQSIGGHPTYPSGSWCDTCGSREFAVIQHDGGLGAHSGCTLTKLDGDYADVAEESEPVVALREAG